jgi:serine/threonine-protein kinase
MRFDYELPEGQQFGNLSLPVLAVSPDGKQFVYSTSKGLYLRSMDELTAKLIAGTEGAIRQPFFSPDGKWVGYWSPADKKLKKIAISGGAPVTLCDVSSVIGASWGADDMIVYADYPKGISRVSANGGIPEVILKGTLVHPQLLPDGKSLLFTSSPTPYKIIVQSLQSGERKELFEGDTSRYVSTGHIIYGMGNNLLAAPFDLKTLKVAGGPVPVVEGVWRSSASYTPQYTISDSGTLVYIPGTTGTAAGGRTLVWVDRAGKEEPITAPPNAYGDPRISPDGTSVALTVRRNTEDTDIWIWDLVRKTMTRLTFDTNYNRFPLWTSDGKRIAFLSNREGGYKTCWKAADGTGKEEILGDGIPASWSSDGKTLVTTEYIVPDRFGIAALSMEGDRKYRPLLREKYNEVEPQISPDGRWMAYASNESGQYEVYMRPFPEVDKGKWQISTSGGTAPIWSRDGRELFYRSRDAVMMVSVKTEPTLRLETPKTLFHGTHVSSDIRGGGEVTPWDISPDGKRFLMMKEVGSNVSEAGGPRKINIVVNWIDELKRRVPVK